MHAPDAAPPTLHQRQDGSPVPGLLVAIFLGAAIVVIAIVIVALSDSALVRGVTVALTAIAAVALSAFVYRMITGSGPAAPEPATDEALPLELRQRPAAARLHAATLTALRDAHGLQRGSAHFAAAAADRARDTGAAALAERYAAQEELARRHADELDTRLHQLGSGRARTDDDEALLSAWLYERLLTHGVVGTARHAYGLLELAAATYTLLEHLGVEAGDEATSALAERCRREVEPLLERWPAAWDEVLDAHVASSADGAQQALLAVLDDARDAEAMRARLLRVTGAHVRKASAFPGAEDAGAMRLLALIDRRRTAVEAEQAMLTERMRAHRHHNGSVRSFETAGAARAAALVEHVRDFKVVRDVRDLLAAERVDAATHGLLALAATRAGDGETAALARRLEAEGEAAARELARELDAALEVAVLAE